MTRVAVRFAVAAGLWACTIAGAAADTLFDVEHARATARVGGPVSDHDAEFLERWGTHSGTPEWRHRPRHADDLRDHDGPPRAKRHRRLSRE